MPRSKLCTSDFDYPIPNELIAHHPADKRENSRLMLLNRENKTIEHHVFSDIIDYLNPSDLLVLNNTKVIPAKLVGQKKEGSAAIEVLLLKKIEENLWETLLKPGKRMKIGQTIIFKDGELIGEVILKKPEGIYLVRFSSKRLFSEMLQEIGEVPLPPYIKSTGHRERYQTVYADKEGASAAPTAGLHFSKELLSKIKQKGVGICEVTLHTGLATFRPVFTDNIEDHHMHKEYLEVSEESSKQILKAKKEERRVVAVGTTVVRALETSHGKPFRGETGLFIYPGYKLKVVDALITNFHFPRSTLIMLVSAFAGRDFIFKAYEEAIKQKYRFYSFGDAMLIT